MPASSISSIGQTSHPKRTAATLARLVPEYGGRLARFQRHVVFVKPSPASSSSGPFIVLYDDLEAKEPSTFQFMLHALQEFRIDEPKSRLIVEQPRAGVEVQYLSPTALTFRQWDGFAPPPTREFPNQWHVEASTTDNLPAFAMLTVIVPYRVGQRHDWSAERIETDDAIRMIAGGDRTIVSIPKVTSSGALRVERK